MAMLASDAQNPEFVNAHDPDSRLSVRFYPKAVQQPFLTEKEGRPIFKDEIFIQIFAPGTQDVIDRPVLGVDKLRFMRQWEIYEKTHGDTREVGTPLSAWALLTGAQAEELKGVKFFTVEQIAGASDEQLGRVGMLAGMDKFVFRSRAQAFLKAASDSAPFEQAAADVEKLRKENAADKAAHALEMAALRKMVEDLTAPKTDKLTLPKKVVA